MKRAAMFWMAGLTIGAAALIAGLDEWTRLGPDAVTRYGARRGSPNGHSCVRSVIQGLCTLR